MAGEMVTKGDASSIHTPSVQYWMFLLVAIVRDRIAVDVGCCSPSPPALVGIVAICVEWRGMLFEYAFSSDGSVGEFSFILAVIPNILP